MRNKYKTEHYIFELEVLDMYIVQRMLNGHVYILSYHLNRNWRINRHLEYTYDSHDQNSNNFDTTHVMTIGMSLVLMGQKCLIEYISLKYQVMVKGEQRKVIIIRMKMIFPW